MRYEGVLKLVSDFMRIGAIWLGGIIPDYVRTEQHHFNQLV